MFDKIKACFETYSRSSDFHSDKTLRTIYVKKSSKMVANDIIEIYPSISEAERHNNCHTHIKDVCHGKRKSAGGYGWKFIT